MRDALNQAGPIARQEVVRTLSGIDIGVIWNILVGALQDVALYYGGSVVLGTAIGGIGGAFFGGVGAIPGAAAGAGVGSQVGAWIMAFLGLKSLVEGLAHTIPDAVKCYERGIVEAWGPTPRDRQSSRHQGGNVFFASHEIARGHVLMLLAILTALVAYLTRGRGNRAKILQEIRDSPRLGPKVAAWVEQNEEKLTKHPALQPRSPAVRAAAAEEEQAAQPRQPREEPASRKPRPMARKRVRCFEPNDLPQAKIPEFDRQLQGQEDGLNDMSVQEYLDGREAFDSGATSRDPNVAKLARAEYQQKLTEDHETLLRNQGVSWKEAAAKAAEMAESTMSTLAALHNPDMISAGKDVIADFGDRNVNSRIGAQWKSRVGDLDKAAKEVPVEDRASVKMNAQLERC